MFVGAVPNRLRGVFVEQFVDPEVAFQFEMHPVVKRIAQRVGHSRGPCLELLKRWSVSGAILFGHAVGAHRAPFVVVPLKPDFTLIWGQSRVLTLFSLFPTMLAILSGALLHSVPWQSRPSTL